MSKNPGNSQIKKSNKGIAKKHEKPIPAVHNTDESNQFFSYTKIKIPAQTKDKTPPETPMISTHSLIIATFLERVSIGSAPKMRHGLKINKISAKLNIFPNFFKFILNNSFNIL